MTAGSITKCEPLGGKGSQEPNGPLIGAIAAVGSAGLRGGAYRLKIAIRTKATMIQA
jgi:hypothetical protein